MKIRTKYLGFLSLFIIMFTGLILGVVLHMKKLNSKNIKEMLNYQNENEMVYSLELSLNKLIMPANDYLIHGDEEERYTFEDLVFLKYIKNIHSTSRCKTFILRWNGYLFIIPIKIKTRSRITN